MSKKMKTIHDTGFSMIHNELLFCPDLHNCSKLLFIIKNMVNTYKNYTVSIDKKLLRRGLGNCIDDTIYNQARELKALGFLENYSKEGGENGKFVFTIVKDHKKNPYVELSIIENQIIERCDIKKNTEQKNSIANLLYLIEKVSQTTKKDLITRFENENAGHLLEEYESYLISEIEKSGIATVTPSKFKGKGSTEEKPVEPTIIKELFNYFYDKYRLCKGVKHSTNKKEALSHITELFESCNKNIKLTREYIDAFFEYFRDKDPKTSLIIHPNVLSELKLFIEKGIPPKIYETREKIKFQKEKQVKEPTQENKGMPLDMFLERIKK